MSQNQRKYLLKLINKVANERNSDNNEFLKTLLQKNKAFPDYNFTPSLSIESNIDKLSRNEVSFCLTYIKENYILTPEDKYRIHFYFCHKFLSNKDLENLDYEALTLTLNRNEDTLTQKKIKHISELTDGDYFRLFKELNWYPMNKIINFKKNRRDFIYQKNNKYELGFEHDIEIFYLKFYFLWMTDIDNKNSEQIVTNVESFCKDNPMTLFALYQTKNGFHIFCLSHLIYHQSIDNIILQEKLGGDPWYTTFSYNDGYKIRISHKKNTLNEFVTKPYKIIGTGKKLPMLENLLQFHDKVNSLNLKYNSDYHKELEPYLGLEL